MAQKDQLLPNPQVRTDEPMDLAMEQRLRRYPGGIRQIIELQERYNRALTREFRGSVMPFPRRTSPEQRQSFATLRPSDDKDYL